MTRSLLRTAVLLLAPAVPLSAQIIFQEDFDGIGGPTAGGPGTYSFPSGWLLRNVDNRTPAANVSYVNEAWERREDFQTSVIDSVAFSTSWYAPGGSADDWMWTPAITLTDNNTLRWKAKAYDPLFLDGYEVRTMVAPNTPTGGSGVIGNQVSASTVLFTTTAEASAWTDHNVSLAGNAGQTVRIAFRNNSNDKFLLVIDDVVVERQLDIDAQMLTADLPTLYTLTPAAQGAPLTLHGSIRNNGVQALTGASAHVDVLRDGTNVFSQNSTAAGLAAGATAEWTIPGYVPTAPGAYAVRYVAQQTSGTDQVPSNDTLFNFFTVTDTVYARDNGEVTGSLGIGAGNGGYLGQSYELVTGDTLTSVSAYFTQGYLNTRAAAVVWDMVDGQPNAIVAWTDTLLYPDDSARFYTFNMHGGGKVLGAGMYAVTAVEFDSTLALGQTSGIFTTGTTWVDWPTSPVEGWAHNEDFGPSFSKSYVIRPNFGHVCSGFLLDASSTDATCASCTDGSVTAEVTGNNGEVTYAWDPNIGAAATILDVAHGLYTVTVTDALGCMASMQVTVAFDTCGAIAAEGSYTEATCATCTDGSATVTVIGDNGGLIYAWGSGGTEATEEDLATGTYNVTVTDMYGCSLSIDVTVPFDTCGAFAATVHSLDASCSTCDDGSAWVDVTGDNGGLTYEWNTGADTDSIGDVLPGDYTVTVTDQYGCTAEMDVTVGFGTGVDAVGASGALGIYPNPGNGNFRLSLGKVAGAVEATIVNTAGAIVWSQRWTGLTNGTVDVSTGLAAGSYTLKVRTNDDVRTAGVIITGR